MSKYRTPLPSFVNQKSASLDSRPTSVVTQIWSPEVETDSDKSRARNSNSTDDSWIVTRGSSSVSTHSDQFSTVKHPSGVYNLVDLLEGVDAENQASDVIEGLSSYDKHDLQSATPPPIAFHNSRSSESKSWPWPQQLQPPSPTRLYPTDLLHPGAAPKPPEAAHNYRRTSLGDRVECVNGVILDAQPASNESLTRGLSNIPEIEARDIRSIDIAKRIEDACPDARHQAQSPPPIQQRRSSHAPPRQIPPRPANAGTTHHLVDRYSSYTGTRPRVPRPDHFEELGVAPIKADPYRSHDGTPSRLRSRGTDHSQAAREHASHDIYPSSQSGSLKAGSDPSRMSPLSHSSYQPPTASSMSSIMQQKIASSAQLIEDNLPWNKIRAPARSVDY